MENAKRKRGRPRKRKAMEFEGMTYEGAINNALDKEVAAELDDTLAHKDESSLPMMTLIYIRTHAARYLLTAAGTKHLPLLTGTKQRQ